MRLTIDGREVVTIDELDASQNRFKYASELAVERGLALDALAGGILPEDTDPCIQNAAKTFAKLTARIAELEGERDVLRSAARAILDDEMSDCRKSLADQLEEALRDHGEPSPKQEKEVI